MKTSHLQEQVSGIPIISVTYQLQKSSERYLTDPTLQNQYPNSASKQVRVGSNITETIKGKLRLGARILRVGGVEKIFKKLFSVREGERVLKASHCYLSTTSGPIAGLLFISTDKVAFCSDRSIQITSPKGETFRVYYKVVIPLKKIKCVNQSENVEKPKQKYLEIVTVDNFDFWFMGFLNYKKSFRYLQQVVSQA
ncbi:hypothetical protein L6164_001931 [Bauhinia variegata]|uniref:Uncharacterized protein n=1 Tax=Bauhinia variegata TaxID=167791 RepID=A0ACB9QBN2_BAUVA|nr:hypothetical protein L6164_001931 [Bauhinia variegata]